MTLPKQVQDASDVADKIESEIVQPQIPVEQPPEPIPEPAPQNDVPDHSEEVRKLQSQYSTLQGKYNAEVPELNRRLHEKDDLIRQLQEEKEALQQEAAKAAEGTNYLTESDVENYGEDMVDMVRRGVKEGLAPVNAELAKYKEFYAKAEKELQDSQAREADRVKAMFADQMDKLCPQWREQDTDQRFVEWLKQPDPQLGVVRQAVLDVAAQQNNAQQVAQIFNAYRAEAAAQRQSRSLGSQITPTHSRNGVTPQTSQPRQWTSKMIEQFYRAVQHGEYTDEQKAKLEQEIDAAVAAGRVLA